MNAAAFLPCLERPFLAIARVTEKEIFHEKTVFCVGHSEGMRSRYGRQTAVCFGLFWEYVSAMNHCGNWI
jgi:hypothetical protein